MRQKFTGFHMAAILVGFFAIVIAVNFTMARLAVGTFGGTLAKNGYVASQDYNRWIAESRAQDALGWDVDVRVEGDRLRVNSKAAPNTTLTVVAEHPLGRVDDHQIAMVAVGPGQFQSEAAMPSGRWKLRITLRQGDNEARFLREATI